MLPLRTTIWIGLHRDSAYGSAFRWTDNSAFDYVNWAAGEPDSVTYRNYVYIARDARGMWRNLGSHGTLGAVCKRNLEQSQPIESIDDYSGFNND